jgi:hypothetical protein
MQHSIAAKYAARSAASFVRPSSRVRERRLGLRPRGSFQPASPRATVLRHNDLPPLVRLRASWRTVTPASAIRPVGGRVRPVVSMSWARSGRPELNRRSGAAAAPWLG